jgi:hypothetical protein
VLASRDTATVEWMDPHVEPFRRWREERRRDPGPPPSQELGRNLDTLADVDVWLSHPSNWVGGKFDIVRWDGFVPRIADAHAWQLAPGCWGREMMLRVVLLEHRRRKRGGHHLEDVPGADGDDV